MVRFCTTTSMSPQPRRNNTTASGHVLTLMYSNYSRTKVTVLVILAGLIGGGAEALFIFTLRVCPLSRLPDIDTGIKPLVWIPL